MPGVYEPAGMQYQRCFIRYWGAKDMGVSTAYGEENGSREKMDELYSFGKTIKYD